jgi:signal transduction histidine kinase
MWRRPFKQRYKCNIIRHLNILRFAPVQLSVLVTCPSLIDHMKYIARKTSPLRYSFIILPMCILFGGMVYLFTHKSKAQNLQTSLAKLISARESNSLIDSCIINLYSADNYSRLYTITGNKDYMTKFSRDVSKINAAIDQIRLNEKDQSVSKSSKLKDLFNQKNISTSNYMKLRLLTDSLINNAANIRYSPAKPVRDMEGVPAKMAHKSAIDSLENADNLRDKGKVQAKASVLPPVNKPIEKSLPVPEKKEQEVVLVSNISSDDLVEKKQPKTNYYQAINQANNNLRKDEGQVLMINNSLIDEIISELKDYKAIDQSNIDYSKAELKASVSDVSFENKQISTIALILLFILAILVFYNIWKIFANEKKILEYSKKTEQYAQSKSRFLAGMSHEIRTPLNSIIGFSEQLEQNNLEPSQKEQLSAIRNSSEMLLTLVNDVLDFTKYETGKTSFENSPFLVQNVFFEVFRSMQVQASKKRLRFDNQVKIDRELCCEGDSMRLKQVLMNLLGNAIKFTITGSVILRAVIEENTRDGVILKVEIEDSGLGIAREDLPHIFEEFTQVGTAQRATKRKGTGLGLAICKKIIELQGGRIDVVSEVGKGSVFSMELPLKKCEWVKIEETQLFSDEEMSELVNHKHVLFVEDNPLNVLLGRTILKKWKINYDIAYNGIEALEFFKQNDYDVVLTDIQMPEMDGLELTELIRAYEDESRSNIPVIALTASVLEDEKESFFNAGFNYIVMKPFREKDLIEKISLCIQSNMSALQLSE